MNEEFQKALIKLLVDNPTWVKTNTPPSVLTDHMIRSLALFEATLTQRSLVMRRPTGIEDYPYEYPKDHVPSR